jgi:hypothetical protein
LNVAPIEKRAAILNLFDMISKDPCSSSSARFLACFAFAASAALCDDLFHQRPPLWRKVEPHRHFFWHFKALRIYHFEPRLDDF